jgi:hypothetical protein
MIDKIHLVASRITPYMYMVVKIITLPTTDQFGTCKVLGLIYCKSDYQFLTGDKDDKS